MTTHKDSAASDIDTCPIPDCGKTKAQNVPGPPDPPRQWFCLNHRHLADEWNRNHPPRRAASEGVPKRIFVWNDERGFGSDVALNRTAESDIEYARVRSDSPSVDEAAVRRGVLAAETDGQSSLMPASEMIDRELVQLALESHARALMYPNSKVQHDRANECSMELLRRLNTRYSDAADHVAELRAQITQLEQDKRGMRDHFKAAVAHDASGYVRGLEEREGLITDLNESRRLAFNRGQQAAALLEACKETLKNIDGDVDYLHEADLLRNVIKVSC